MKQPGHMFPLLLATLMASKRRAADLVGLVAALDLILEGAIPPPLKLIDAFKRLSTHGLIAEAEGGHVDQIGDYEAAIGLATAALMRVHTSNFMVVGFTQQASLDELVSL